MPPQCHRELVQVLKSDGCQGIARYVYIGTIGGDISGNRTDWKLAVTESGPYVYVCFWEGVVPAVALLPRAGSQRIGCRTFTTSNRSIKPD